MKKLLVLGLLASLTWSAMGQGIVFFNNRVTGSVDAKIYLDTIGGPALSGADTSFKAALLGGAVGSTASSLAGIGTLKQLSNPETGVSAVAFRTGAAAGYVSSVNTGRDSQLAYGSTGIFQVVAWQGNYTTWAEAYAAALVPGSNVKIGFSNPVTVTVTANQTDTATPYLVGMNSFAIALVPEPSSMALAGLGAAALLIFRRRK